MRDASSISRRRDAHRAESRLGPAAVEPLVVPACAGDPADGRNLARARTGPCSCRATSSDLDGLPVTGLDGAPTTLAAFLDQTFTDGFLVLKDGAIVYERYLNGMDERTLHLSQSVAKSFTGALAGILVGARRDRRHGAGHRLSARAAARPPIAAPPCSTSST